MRTTFDAADRVKTETDAEGNVTTYTYDPAGNVIAVLDAEGHTARVEYDAMNRKTAVIDATGYRSETKYNLRGDVIGLTNANGEQVRFEIDALGRKTALIDARGYRTEYRYDANGNLTCTIDANAQAGLQPKNTQGCTEYRTYDELNRVATVVDAQNGATVFTYDLLGNRLSIQDAAAKTWRFAYDDLGRLISETDHSNRTLRYKPDEAGNIYEKTNRLAEVTRYSYDTGNRLTRVDYLKDASVETFGYDPAGNRASAGNGAVSYSFQYDRLNRLLQKLDSRGRSLSFTYDRVGNLLTKTTYQGSTTSYVYNAANRRVMLRNPDYTQIDYQYDPAGRLLSRVTASGARTRYQYDANGGLTNLTQYDAADALVSDTTYTRDRVGNLLTAVDASGTTTYVYDALYRLKTADYPGTANDELFSYDTIGNRTQSTQGSLVANTTTRYYTYTTGTNRLANLRIGSTAGTLESGFTYDFEGRLTGQTGVGAKTLTWDAKGRVKTVGSEAYSYDAMDYRIGRSGGSLGSRDYFLEGEHLESVYQGGVLKEKYFRGTAVDELVAGFLVDTDAKLKPYLFHHDQVNSVSAVSGHDGGTVQTIKYFAFGALQSSTGASPSRLKYTGREDDQTGLYYYRARYYDPNLGRFISEDPKGFEAGINFYAYVGNNPVNGNDPSGLDTRISIGYTRTPVPGTNHQLVILTDTVTGQQFATRAGPASQGFSGSASNSSRSSGGGSFSASSGNGGSGGYGFGQINAVARPFNADFKDVPSTVHTIQNVGVIERDYADSVKNATEFANVTNQNNIPYFPLGLNSNSYASTFVQSLTGSRPTPIVTAPGASFGQPSSTLSYKPSPFVSNSAGGGFVLYPNKPNTNMMQSVYAK